jgi:hypothetical protein
MATRLCRLGGGGRGALRAYVHAVSRLWYAELEPDYTGPRNDPWNWRLTSMTIIALLCVAAWLGLMGCMMFCPSQPRHTQGWNGGRALEGVRFPWERYSAPPDQYGRPGFHDAGGR